MPDHVCTKSTTTYVQVMHNDIDEILSDDMFDVVVDREVVLAEMELSINALSGGDHTKTIRLRALIGNRVVLILLDPVGTHSFLDSALVSGI